MQKEITDDFNENDKVKSDLNLWDYKDEKELIGVVIEIDENGAFGRSVTVDTKDKKGVTIPSLTALQTKLAQVKIGNKVKIVNKGLVRGKNKRDYYDFDVFIKQ